VEIKNAFMILVSLGLCGWIIRKWILGKQDWKCGLVELALMCWFHKNKKFLDKLSLP
jgi:hypothetical protein